MSDKKEILEIVINGKKKFKVANPRTEIISRLFKYTLGIPRYVSVSGLTSGFSRKLEFDGVYSWETGDHTGVRRCDLFEELSCMRSYLFDGSGSSLIDAKERFGIKEPINMGLHYKFGFLTSNGYVKEDNWYVHRIIGDPTDFPNGSPAMKGPNGVVYMTKGKVHKVGGPAIVPNKGKSIYIPRQGRTFYYPAYYQNNKLHRVDGPAYKTGEEQHYYYNDKRHRIDGPAHYSSNIAHWYKYGMKHRDGHPAEQESDSFWFYDTRHNLDGPAKLDDDDNPCYYILGIRMTKAEWQRMRKDPNVVGMVENTRQAVEEANAFLFTKENIDVDSSTFRSMF